VFDLGSAWEEVSVSSTKSGKRRLLKTLVFSHGFLFTDGLTQLYGDLGRHHPAVPWITMNATQVRVQAAISTRNGFTLDFAITP
jgi:hypothetical protein